jgi:tetratricopeptide (TPR) repeat protein
MIEHRAWAIHLWAIVSVLAVSDAAISREDPPPENLSAVEYNDRGITKVKGGDFNGAITDFSKAIELKPRYANAYNNRGSARHDTGDLKGAIADYTKAIELDPGLATAFYNRGRARKQKGDFQDAIKDLTKAVELDSETGECLCHARQRPVPERR